MSESAFGNAMPAEIIDKDIQEWERIDNALGFRMPNGDEYEIARQVMCPDCGHVYVLGIANGDTVSYARRHPKCAVNNQARGQDDEERDNG